MNPQSAAIVGSGNPLKSRFESEIRAKIVFKIRRSICLFNPLLLKIEKKCAKIVLRLGFFFFFHSYNNCLISANFFPVVNSHSISPIAKTFNHRMRSFKSFIILLRCMSTLHVGYRTFAVHHEKSLFPVFFKVSILNTYLLTLHLEK